MKSLKYCSNCGKKNKFSFIDSSQRYHCIECDIIHYENPKPTVILICPNNKNLLLVKRAFGPGKGLWGFPGGFIESKETAEAAAIRELKEETNLNGEVVRIIDTCSHFNTIFGDILLIGYEIFIKDWSILKAGDDACEAQIFNKENMPNLAFRSHKTMLRLYNQKVQIG